MQFSSVITAGDAGEAALYDDVQSSGSLYQPWQALCFLARLHYTAAYPELLLHGRGLSCSNRVYDRKLLGAAKQLGLKAKISCARTDRLLLVPRPAVARLAVGDGGRRWVLLARFTPRALAALPMVQKREDDFETLSDQGLLSQHAGQESTQARFEMERDLACATRMPRRNQSRHHSGRASPVRLAHVNFLGGGVVKIVLSAGRRIRAISPFVVTLC